MKTQRARWMTAGIISFAYAALLLLTSKLAHWRGLGVGGDEPSYLQAAASLGRFHTIDNNATFPWLLSSYPFGHFSKSAYGHMLYSFQGMRVPVHPLGLPAVLAIPVAIGGLQGGQLALALLTSLGTLWLVRLIADVAQLRGLARWAPVGLFLAPAYMLSSIQVYPDLLSGLSVGIVLLHLAKFELGHNVSKSGFSAVGILLGFLPWLHVQNLIFALILLVAIGVAAHQAHLDLSDVRRLMLPALLGWIAFVIYNLAIFGNPLGFPDSRFDLNLRGFTRILALFVDRQQGLLVQIPVIILGISLLVAWRRRIPLVGFSVLAITILATCIGGAFSNSFGGASLVGRFNWVLMPSWLALSSLTIAILWQSHRSFAAGISAIVAAVYLGQSAPIALGHHLYSTLGIKGVPAGGWWGVLDGYLPSFQDLDGAWGSSYLPWAVSALLALLACWVLLTVRLLNDVSFFNFKSSEIAIGLLTVLSLVVVLAIGPGRMPKMTFLARDLSTGAATVIGSDVGVSGSRDGGATILNGPGWANFPSGDYRISVIYSLDARYKRAAKLDVYLLALNSSSNRQAGCVAGTSYLANGRSMTASQIIPLRPSQQVFARLNWQGPGNLRVRRLTIEQVDWRHDSSSSRSPGPCFQKVGPEMAEK